MILAKPRPTAESPAETAQFLAMAKAMAAVKVVRRWGLPGSRTPSSVGINGRDSPWDVTDIAALGTPRAAR